MQRVLHEHGHRPCDTEIFECQRLSVLRRPEDDSSHPLAQIAERRGVAVAVDQRQDRHEFGRDRDVEAGLPGTAVGASTQTDDDIPECAVVDVDHAVPLQLEGVDVQA